MAIAFDTATGTVVSTGSPSTINWSHTCTGSNLNLVVHVYNDDGTDKVTGVTYNSVAMTRVQVKSTVAKQTVYSYILINPTTGANTVVVTASAGSNQLGGISQSYTGCAQSGQPDSSNNNSQLIVASPFTVTDTVINSNCWLVGCERNDSEIPTAGSGTIIRDTRNTMTGTDSNGTVGTGSQTQNWVVSAGSSYTGVIMALTPFGAISNTANFLSLLGVGS